MVEEVTLATFYQKYEDNHSHLQKAVDEIKAQVLKTNGRVNKHDIEMALMQSRYDNCPAREWSRAPNVISKRGNLLSLAAIMLSAIALLVTSFCRLL